MNDKATSYEESDPKTATKIEKEKYYEKCRKEFKYDLIAHDNYIKDFDAYESMLISRPYDSISRKAQNGLSDGRTTTIYLERAGRVVGKLPEGQMKAAGEHDDGVAAVLEILRTKWLYPNANAQKKFLKKIRLWQFNSSVYGFMPMYYDWNVTDTGYVGPDCWLWHPRNFVPQLGRATIDDMDYCHSITYVGEGYLEDLLEEDDSAGWDKEEVKRLLEIVNDKTRDVSSQRDSFVTRQRQSQAEKGRIMLTTRYESGADGTWTVIAPEYNGIVLRCIPNPHKNGRIPFVIKYATDLFDNIYGLGDFQRAKPIQFANDGLDNFYFMGIKKSLFPATIINPAGVVKSSITQDPGAIYLETVPNSIREYRTDPGGMNTYQGAKQTMNGALLNQAGTTDLSITASSSNDPSYSKTDSGVNSQDQKESTRDALDRFELESSLETLIDRMMGLIPAIGTEAIPIDLFYDDIQEIMDMGYGDSLQSLITKGTLKVSGSGQSAHLNIPQDFFKGMEMRFHMTYTSTAQEDKSTQLKALDTFISDMTSMQNEMVEMKNQGMTIDWPFIAKLKGELADVPQMGKIFRRMTPQESQQWQQSQQEGDQKTPSEKLIENMNYKDLPADIQRQVEAQAGFTPSTDGMTADQHIKTTQAATAMHTAIQSSPDMQETVQPQPQPQVQPPSMESEPLSLATHKGQPIHDAKLAMLHNHIGSLIENGK